MKLTWIDAMRKKSKTSINYTWLDSGQVPVLNLEWRSDLSPSLSAIAGPNAHFSVWISEKAEFAKFTNATPISWTLSVQLL